MKVKRAVKLRQESVERDRQLASHVASVALAVEALEGILTEKRLRWPWSPVLRKDELMERLKKLAQEKNHAGSDPANPRKDDPQPVN